MSMALRILRATLAEPLYDREQRCLDVTGLVADLEVGEAQRGQPGGGVSLVAPPVAHLLGDRAVVAQAVGLDHESKLGPVEVDLETVQPGAGVGQR